MDDAPRLVVVLMDARSGPLHHDSSHHLTTHTPCMCIQLGEAPGVAGQAYFVTNDAPLPFWDFLSDVLTGFGYPAPRCARCRWAARTSMPTFGESRPLSHTTAHTTHTNNPPFPQNTRQRAPPRGAHGSNGRAAGRAGVSTEQSGGQVPADLHALPRAVPHHAPLLQHREGMRTQRKQPLL